MVAVVLDLYSRRVIAWGMGRRLTQDLATGALTMAVARRCPSEGVLHHTDRGSQYAATVYRALLTRHGLTASMSRRANCWDNAVVESFFHPLKTELVYHRRYMTRAEAQQDILSGSKCSIIACAGTRLSATAPPPSSRLRRQGLN